MSDIEAMETASAPLPDEAIIAASQDESEQVEQEAETPEETEATAEVSAEAEDVDEDIQVDEPEAPKETKNQRKRRMRRERELKTEGKLQDAQQEITRLNQEIGGLKIPNYNDFENPDDYVAERAAHATQRTMLQADAARASGSVQAAQAQVQAERQTAISDTFDEGNGSYKDFNKIVRNESLQLSGNMLSASLEAENTSDVLYFLGKNLDEAARISSLTDIAQVIEIGKMSANLSSKKNRTTKAKPPIKTLKGSSGSVDKNPEEMTNDEYRKWRNNGQ
ncbi:MAG: hypothetical protein JKY52_08555 [Flavobacteriales bacterium]|nr:hypothetical protein [Flavobacteriales bacterium]